MAKMLLPRGEKMAIGCMVCWKHDANGNPINRFNQNILLNTGLYKMEFPRVEMTELVAQIIAESIYA